ncbi:MAG: hypothetical protein ACOH10_15025 [Rhodoglobus sp.]
MTTTDLNSRLVVALERLGRAAAAVASTHARAESATTGGLSNYDPAILSGIRRKPNPKADARRFAAYDREAAAYAEHTAAEKAVASLVRQVATQERNDASRALVTPESIKAAQYVRDSSGWHRVVRHSAKSVSVETPWSWTDRIPLDKILETRAAA